jgi:hypothetical protein
VLFIKDKFFVELIASLRAGGEILWGKKQPSRSFKIIVPKNKPARLIINRKSKAVNC